MYCLNRAIDAMKRRSSPAQVYALPELILRSLDYGQPQGLCLDRVPGIAHMKGRVLSLEEAIGLWNLDYIREFFQPDLL